MFNSIKKLTYKLYNNNIIRYVFFGALTTFVNLITYLILRKFINFNIANFISIVLAICFAYVVNSRFVFKSTAKTIRERANEFLNLLLLGFQL